MDLKKITSKIFGPKKPFWAYLPIGSGLHYHRHHDKRSFLGYTKHITYPLLFTPIKYVLPWIIAGIGYGEWNPAEQIKNVKQDLKPKQEIYNPLPQEEYPESIKNLDSIIINFRTR